MDEDRKASIGFAFQKHRAAVLDLNLAALQFVAHALEEEPSPENYPEDEVRDLKLQLLRDEYGIHLEDEELASISDFLSEDHLEKLTATCSLDGVNHGEVDEAARESWFGGLWSDINSIGSGERRPQGLPKDLRYLSTLVPGIYGPGLPNYRGISQFSFLTDMNSMSGYEEHRVDAPLSQRQMDNNEFNALSSSFDSWEISVGVRISDGPRAWGGGFAIFCRLPDSDRGDWKWRYGIRDDTYSSDLYDTFEAFLMFYARFQCPDGR